MSARTLSIGLATIMAVAVVLSFTATRDSSKPNLEIMPDMAHGASYQAFEANPNTPDGKTLRQPAPGSIPRGLLPLPYEATEPDALRAGRELVNPFGPDDEDVLARGAIAYAIFCQQCHGPTGGGDGMVANQDTERGGGGFPPPPTLLREEAIDMKDGQMFHVITFGQGNMPAHAAQVSRDDRWKIITHLRTLQANPTTKPAGATQPATATQPAGATQPTGAQPG